MTVELGRAAHVRSGIQIEVVTVAWMVLEALIAVGAGIAASSLLLIAFGVDSLIELVSGLVLLWRLIVEAQGGDVGRAEGAEGRARWIVAIALAVLCAYVLATAIYGLVTQERPESSPVGIALAIAAMLVMPWLAFTKRRIAGQIDSEALRADAACSLTCGYMAGTVLLGLALNAALHWWWAEDVAALGFLFWLLGETREAFEEARESA